MCVSEQGTGSLFLFLNMYTCTVCLGSRAAGTVYFATPCIIRLMRTKMLALQTVFVWIGMIPAPRTQENSGSFTEGRDRVVGPAKVSMKGCVSLENNKERGIVRNSKAFFHYVIFKIKKRERWCSEMCPEKH